MGRSPESVEAFFAEVGSARDPRLARSLEDVRAELADFDQIEVRARRIVEKLALAVQASLLLRHGDPAVAEAFCVSRLGGDHGRAFGTLPRAVDFGGILERAWS